MYILKRSRIYHNYIKVETPKLSSVLKKMRSEKGERKAENDFVKVNIYYLKNSSINDNITLNISQYFLLIYGFTTEIVLRTLKI